MISEEVTESIVKRPHIGFNFLGSISLPNQRSQLFRTTFSLIGLSKTFSKAYLESMGEICLEGLEYDSIGSTALVPVETSLDSK